MTLFTRKITKDYRDREVSEITGLTKLGCLTVFLVPLLLCSLTGIIFSIKTINPQQAAVATRFGEFNGIRSNGTYLALFEDYTIYDLTSKQVVGKHEGGSKDGQFIFVDVAFNYSLKSDKLQELYAEVGDQNGLEEKFIHPVLADVIKQTTAQYGAGEILSKQAEFRQKVLEVIKERMNQEYLRIVDFQVTNIDFTKEYNSALEQKQINEQNALSGRQVAEQDLQRKKIELESTRIEAQKQKLLQQSLTSELLQKMWVEKWNGILPTTMTGNSNLLLPLK